MQNLPNSIFESIDDFLISQDSKPLGSGSFGIVRKAIHKATGKAYAIKIIKLDENMNQPEMLLLTRQISIHYQLNHPHIIKLWAVLEQNDKIYMVMDYAQNGNLFHYFNRKKMLSETQSYKIFYQVLDAIQYMHKIDVFHRDIKPQNILLDHQFNVKLCDFGWVADQINRKRNTFCGTYQYMAPQMIKDMPYNYKIDIWALGVLLYELNHGKAPFPADSIQMIKQRFEKGTYQIKQTLSEQFKMLVVGILQFDPNKRIQIADIKNSKWVKNNRHSLCFQSSHSLNRNSSMNKSDLLQQCQSAMKLSQKQDKFVDQKLKKYHKKYRTLQQQDLYSMANNLGLSKHTIVKQNEKYLQSTKQPFIKQKTTKDTNHYDQNIKSALKQGLANLNAKQFQNPNQNQNQDHKDIKQEKRKKKVGSTRIHTRTGTESNQFLNKKLSKVVFQQKLKIFNDQRKKKIGTKRS